MAKKLEDDTLLSRVGEVRIVHKGGFVKTIDVYTTGRVAHVYWPLCGMYRIFKSGRIAGAPSWRVCADDIDKLPMHRHRAKKIQLKKPKEDS